LGEFRTTKADYQRCMHGERTQLRKTKFDEFTPVVLGVGKIGPRSREVDAVCAIFDLQGFTDFSRQVDPQLVLPAFLSEFLEWLFASVRENWIVRKYEDPN